MLRAPDRVKFILWRQGARYSQKRGYRSLPAFRLSFLLSDNLGE